MQKQATNMHVYHKRESRINEGLPHLDCSDSRECHLRVVFPKMQKMCIPGQKVILHPLETQYTILAVGIFQLTAMRIRDVVLHVHILQ